MENISQLSIGLSTLLDTRHVIVAALVRKLAGFCFLVLWSSSLCAGEVEPLEYDISSGSDEMNQTYRIATDSREPISLEIRLTNRAHDTLCEKTVIYSQATVSKSKPVNRTFSFSRKGSPNIALYEWHLCFEIDGVTYKAWRGFDPGPETFLTVRCFIGSQLLSSEETNKYLCESKDLKPYQANYAEFAQYCWAKDVCRRFETEDEYNLFLQRGAENAAFYSIEEPVALGEKEVKYDYLEEDQARELLNSMLKTEEEYCLELDGSAKELCLSDLSGLRESVPSGAAWRYRLSEKSFKNAFPEIGGAALFEGDATHFGGKTTYKFKPHTTKGRSVYFYTITCREEADDLKSALCALSLNQAFYVNDPLNYFYVEETTNLDTALWAFKASKSVKIIPDSDWVVKWLSNLPRVSRITIDADVAKFTHHSGGCSLEILYRIVGRNEKLEFLKIGSGICI